VKVAVLGGTGFVGAHVVRALVKAGHEVTAVVRPTSPREVLAGTPVTFVKGDLTDPATLVAAFAGQEAVVHCAGLLSLWRKEADTLHRTNVLGTRNVVEACLHAGVRRLVWDGSVGVYAGSTSPTPVDERGAPTAERYHSYHVVSMALGEAEVWKGAARGLEVVLLHPGLCLGEGDRNFHAAWAIVGIAFARLPVCPPGGLNLIDVLDVAKAHVAALEVAPPASSYLLGGENLTNRAYADLLREVLGIRTPVLPIPRAGMHALGRAGEAFARVLGVDRGSAITLNEAIGTAMALYWFVDDSRARRELGHSPSPVRQALEREVRWLRQEGLLPDAGFGARDFMERFYSVRP
jgi:dihydroflavonol-4-reductase